jgi:hypothetical protein
MEKQESKKYSGSWFLLLFGIPFMGIGIFLLTMSWEMASLYHQSRNWIRVPAIVTSANLQSHRGSKGGYSYSVECQYTYTVNDRAYTGTRVGVETHGGSSDSYHRRRHDILAGHRDNNTTLDVWVNPANPQMAIAFREVTTTMYVIPMCGIVFGAPGLVLFLMGVRSFFTTCRSNVLLARNPGRPWRANPRYRSFELKDNPLRRIAGVTTLGVFTGIFVGVFWIAMGKDPGAPLFARIIIALLTLIPAGMFMQASYQLFRYFKYGNPRLVLRQIPFVMGQENTALLHLNTNALR